MVHHHVDQALLYKATKKTTYVKIYNRDLSDAMQCGNGLRALAHHLDRPTMTFEIHRQQYLSHKENDKHWINMGKGSYLSQQSIEQYTYHVLSIGNLHGIFINTPVLPNHKLATLSQEMNLSFINHTGQNNIEIKTYERGVGWTQACASASCAATFLIHQSHPQIHTWRLINPGGILLTQIKKQSLMQTGEVSWLCQTQVLERE